MLYLQENCYEAHDKGCAFVKEHAMIKCDESLRCRDYL